MRVEAFKFSEADDGIAKIAETLPAQFLHGHVAHELVYSESAIRLCKPIRRQDMICAAAIIANRFRRPRPDKYRTRISQCRQRVARILNLQNQVFGRIPVANQDRGIDIVDDDDS